MKLNRSLILALSLTACAHATKLAPAPTPPPAQLPGPPDPLSAIRAEVESLLKVQAETFWMALTQGGTLDVAGTYQGRDRLFSRETIDQVKAALDRASGDERRALSYLQAFLVGERLARRVTVAGNAAAAARTATTFEWDGKEVPVRQFRWLLASEPNAERRAGLERSFGAAIPKWLPLVTAEDRALREAARKLGYPDVLALAEEARGQSVQELAALADGLLAQTDSIYQALMDKLSRDELYVPLVSSRMRDLPRLFHAAHDPRGFPANELVPDAQATFESLGLPLKKLPGLVLDLETRAGKSLRSIVLPVEVPGSIRLSAVPQGGATEARAFLHELGMAVFFTEVNSATMEFRRLGPAAIPGTWGNLFEGLAANPTWLAERTALTGEGLAREIRAGAAEELHQARMDAAQVLYEIERARTPAQSANLQLRLLTRALTRPVDAQESSRWPFEPDPLLHCADRLRARLLAAQAAVFLVKRAGALAWWRSLENGQWLARTWSEGTRQSPQELSAALGEPKLGVTAFVTQSQTRAETAGITR